MDIYPRMKTCVIRQIKKCGGKRRLRTRADTDILCLEYILNCAAPRRGRAVRVTYTRDGEGGAAMKLLFAIVQRDDVRNLTKELVQHNLSVTRISSSGGVLRGGNTTLMIGVEEDRLPEALNIIKTSSSRREVLTTASYALPGVTADSLHSPVLITVGGATVFVVDVEQYYKL